MAREAFSISEQLDIPVVIRLTGAYFESNSLYNQVKDISSSSANATLLHQPVKYVVHPYYFIEQEKRLSEKKQKIQEFVDEYSSRSASNYSRGVVVVGAVQHEESDEEDTYRSYTLPLPAQLHEFIELHDTVSITEDGDAFVRDKILIGMSGKKLFSVAPTPRGVKTRFMKWTEYEEIFIDIHDVLRGEFVSGDITQFTVETTDTIGVVLSFGTAISTAIGAAEGKGCASYAIVGDTSFLHEGRGALEEAKMRGVRIGVIIIDNGISWCTGGQKPAGAIENAIKDYPSKTVDLRKGGITGLHEALQEMKSADGLFVLRVVVPDLALRTRS